MMLHYHLDRTQKRKHHAHEINMNTCHLMQFTFALGLLGLITLVLFCIFSTRKSATVSNQATKCHVHVDISDHRHEAKQPYLKTHVDEWINVGTVSTSNSLLILQGRRHPYKKGRYMYRCLSTDLHQQLTLDLDFNGRSISNPNGYGCNLLHSGDTLYIPQLASIATVHISDGSYMF